MLVRVGEKVDDFFLRARRSTATRCQLRPTCDGLPPQLPKACFQHIQEVGRPHGSAFTSAAYVPTASHRREAAHEGAFQKRRLRGRVRLRCTCGAADCPQPHNLSLSLSSLSLLSLSLSLLSLSLSLSLSLFRPLHPLAITRDSGRRPRHVSARLVQQTHEAPTDTHLVLLPAAGRILSDPEGGGNSRRIRMGHP